MTPEPFLKMRRFSIKTTWRGCTKKGKKAERVEHFFTRMLCSCFVQLKKRHWHSKNKQRITIWTLSSPLFGEFSCTFSCDYSHHWTHERFFKSVSCSGSFLVVLSELQEHHLFPEAHRLLGRPVVFPPLLPTSKSHLPFDSSPWLKP